MCVEAPAPEEAKDSFAFEPGQFLTLRATVGGQDVRLLRQPVVGQVAAEHQHVGEPAPLHLLGHQTAVLLTKIKDRMGADAQPLAQALGDGTDELARSAG